MKYTKEELLGYIEQELKLLRKRHRFFLEYNKAEAKEYEVNITKLEQINKIILDAKP